MTTRLLGSPPLRLALCGALVAILAPAVGCGGGDQRRELRLWHQMRPEDREVLDARLAEFQRLHPEFRVRALYKETEELRSGLVAATLAQSGPEIVYGPSDVLGVYHAMGALADMSPWLDDAELAKFDHRSLIRMPAEDDDAEPPLVFVGDRFGNHLALVYDKRRIPNPPTTTDELLKLAKANTVDENGDGEPDRYGLVWNYTEPFFVIPFLTGYGAWVFAEEQPESAGEASDGESAVAATAVHAVPALDAPEAAAAYQFVADLRTKHRVLPRSADYEAAAELFRSGKAAMLIDGDWSWQGYMTSPKIDAAVAVLPTCSATGLPLAPMVAPKGYSLTAFARGAAADDAMSLVEFLTSAETQEIFLQRQRILPSRLALRESAEFQSDPLLTASVAQVERGRLMPTAVEMRAVWDSMRPAYQELMAGKLAPAAAAAKMQAEALRQCAALTNVAQPDATAPLVSLAGLALLVGAVLWQRRALADLGRDLRTNPLAYVFVLPSLAVILLTVLFPLAYNVVLSFTNMSLASLRDWQVVGLGNYAAMLSGEQAGRFWGVLWVTILWTVINVALHVTLGVLLAVALNGPVRGKGTYRLLLIIPWAVPAYITALTWRGMFDFDFGAVNNLVRDVNNWTGQYVDWLQLPVVNWLGEAGPAFAACLVANVWLGFPFMMVIALGGLQGIPAELYEAARIDQASRWQQFRNITLPLLKPVLLPAITLGAVWTFNNLNVVWLVSNGGEPADKTHILVSYVYKAVFNLYQYGYGAALSMVIFLLLLAFSALFLQRTKAAEGAY
ncbi:MAG: extracellular solute-binding protein [Pirellulales bacterium]|nr:extracellular solute-binding protein [Pirellulales bacterium]